MAGRKGVAIRESGYTTAMRLIDLLCRRLGTRPPWPRSRLAYLVLQSIVAAERASTRR